MSLLSLKIRVRKYCLLWAILPFYTGILANDSIPDHTFTQNCNTSDAYLLYSYVDVSYSQLWSSYTRQVSVQNKLVVNNKSGVDKFAFLDLSNLVGSNLIKVQINTLKADGTIVKLDSSLVFKHQADDEQAEHINYPIPGVEPGDTIEISYVYSENLRSYELMDYVNLYRELPSFNTEYTVRSTPELLVRYKTYNDFPEPQVWSNDTLIYCIFKMEKVYGLSENQYTCSPCELPYLYYSMEKKKSKARSWKDVYNQEFNISTQPMRFDYEKSSYYKRWKREVIGDAVDSSKYYKFELLHADIIDNTHMSEIDALELVKSSGYFLKKKRFDALSIRRLYRQLLEDLEIDYWAAFARSKRSGQIDPYYIRKGEFDHTFFAYKNEQGSLNLLYPHEISYKYQINEIPTSLYSTEAVIVKPFNRDKIKKSDKFISYDLELAEVDSVTVEIIILPGMNPNNNYSKQIIYCDVDPEKKTTTFKSQFSVSGGLSTDIRSFFSLLNQDEEMNDFYDAMSEYEGDENSLEIDTITRTTFRYKRPFTYSINAQGTLKNSLSFLNDSIVSITLGNLIQHSQIESDIDSTELNFYLDYTYNDLCMYIINFPCEIEVLNYKNYNKVFKNNTGEYIFNLNLVGNNQLTLQSNYKIIKEMIPKGDYKQLKQLNELVKETKNMRLLIKLLNTNQQISELKN